MEEYFVVSKKKLLFYFQLWSQNHKSKILFLPDKNQFMLACVDYYAPKALQVQWDFVNGKICFYVTNKGKRYNLILEDV